MTHCSNKGYIMELSDYVNLDIKYNEEVRALNENAAIHYLKDAEDGHYLLFGDYPVQKKSGMLFTRDNVIVLKTVRVTI